MDAEEISNLCNKLKLTEEDQEVIIVEGQARLAGDRKRETCLLGKIWSAKMVNTGGLKAAIQAIWRTVNGVHVESLGNNRFIFHFKSSADRNRVLMGGPWLFDKALLVVVEPQGVGDVMTTDFSMTHFWVQFHNIPVVGMTQEMGHVLGGIIGQVTEVDMGGSGECIGRFLRVRIKMDITRPLRRGIRVQIEGYEESCMVLVQYERLPDFCYSCGRLGHSYRECSALKGATITSELVQSFKFGPWLRATILTGKANKGKQRGEDAGGKTSTVQKPDIGENSSHLLVSSTELTQGDKDTDIQEVRVEGQTDSTLASPTKLMEVSNANRTSMQSDISGIADKERPSDLCTMVGPQEQEKLTGRNNSEGDKQNKGKWKRRARDGFKMSD